MAKSKSRKVKARNCATAWKLNKDNFCYRKPGGKKTHCGFPSLSAAKRAAGIR